MGRGRRNKSEPITRNNTRSYCPEKAEQEKEREMNNEVWAGAEEDEGGGNNEKYRQ